ncbi:MAG: putative Mg2+ transporter-C (MgtC) family protein [Francisellaceae bacterium]|jgi:putative Mg2+ transporter-C (MgtC) family protein
MIEIIQILSACICGVAVGIERQHFGSSAGVRTYALVCVGACLYGIISTHAQGAAYYESIVDPTRIAAQGDLPIRLNELV